MYNSFIFKYSSLQPRSDYILPEGAKQSELDANVTLLETAQRQQHSAESKEFHCHLMSV